MAADAGVVLVPSLGDSIVDGTLSAWEVAVGQAVNVDDVVAVLETDKVSMRPGVCVCSGCQCLCCFLFDDLGGFVTVLAKHAGFV